MDRPRWSENQATEILALVLDLDRDLLASFVTAATQVSAGSNDLFEPTTQHPTGRGSDHVDLALQARGWEVWVEAKIDSEEGPDQLQRYAEALSTYESANRHLVYLTRPLASKGPIARLEHERPDLARKVGLHAYDWRRVGQLAEESKAHETRIGKHLATFLKESGLLVPALEKQHIEALEGFLKDLRQASFIEASEAFSQLFWATHSEVSERGLGHEPNWAKRSARQAAGVSEWLSTYPSAWATYVTPDGPFPFGETLPFLEWDLGAEDEDPEAKLTVSAGLTLPPHSGPWEDWELTGTAAANLTQRGDEWPQIHELRHLDQFVRGDLDQDASSVADWIASVFRDLIGNPPIRRSG